MTYAEKLEFEKIESTVEEAEMKLEELDEAMNSAGSDYSKLQNLMEEKEKQNKVLEDLYARWEYLSELAES
jgi:ATP-binding cassette subfamily F protein uup